MKSILEDSGPQGSNPKTRARKTAHVAHQPGPVRRRTLPQNLQPSIRRPGDYESTETPIHSQQWIPASVTASDGRNDKIHMTCEIATVFCEDWDDARSFVSYCGAPPKDQENEHELYSKLFNRASKNGDGKTLDIRSTRREYGNQVFQAPWFTGKLNFKRIPHQGQKVAVVVTADLLLNVNRALNHQRAALKKRRKEAILQSAAPVAFGLCGKDNLAPFKLAGGEHDHARKVCFDLIVSAIYADVKRAAEISNDSGSNLIVTGRPDKFSLQAVETCWDIGGTGFDAVKALADLTPALLEHGGKRVSEGNAGIVTIEFSKSERLVVYAKAPDRLRFEIRHNPPQGNRPYSSATIADTLGKLDDYRESATAKVNAALALLKSPRAASRTGGEWEAYAMAWGACCRNSEASKALFQILRQHGRIHGGKYVECIAGGRELLRKASNAGLIAYSHGAYRPVFSNDPKPALTHLDISSELLGHNTETHPVASAPKIPYPTRKRREVNQIPPSPPVDAQRVTRNRSKSRSITARKRSGSASCDVEGFSFLDQATREDVGLSSPPKQEGIADNLGLWAPLAPPPPAGDARASGRTRRRRGDCLSDNHNDSKPPAPRVLKPVSAPCVKIWTDGAAAYVPGFSL